MKNILQSLKISDMEMYNSYIAASEIPTDLYSANFAYLWSYTKYKKILWTIIDDILIIFGEANKKKLYLFCPPLGAGCPDKVNAVLLKSIKLCKELNKECHKEIDIAKITEAQLSFLRQSETFDKNFYFFKRDGIERHYSIHDLLLLQGNKFSYIRRKINKFYRQNPVAVVRHYQESDYDGLLKLYTLWRNDAVKKYPSIYDAVNYREIIKNYRELEQIVLVIEIEDEIVGMVAGGITPKGQGWCSLRKARNEITGLTEVLILNLAKEINQISPAARLINDGNDLGAGMKYIKEKFRPVVNSEIFSAKTK